MRHTGSPVRKRLQYSRNNKAVAFPNVQNARGVLRDVLVAVSEAGLKFNLDEFAHTVSVYEIVRPAGYTDISTNVFSFGGERHRGRARARRPPILLKGSQYRISGTLADRRPRHNGPLASRKP